MRQQEQLGAASNSSASRAFVPRRRFRPLTAVAPRPSSAVVKGVMMFLLCGRYSRNSAAPTPDARRFKAKGRARFLWIAGIRSFLGYTLPCRCTVCAFGAVTTHPCASSEVGASRRPAPLRNKSRFPELASGRLQCRVFDDARRTGTLLAEFRI